ncbi:SusC/RagA family TonB-linked outer membrane protein [Aestuariibaculum sp. M13]|uniref:SusC/RagA family TonB-linked outer membrane protein n=1 Tax=Aestuariibaculum sp. M13 TaxID=2967132 RepID=UPI002159ED68|nr:SusC/RagA family TonB-linked outer membrane protein [Aestuariibaculum sp. M13]MCR8667475.1 SusC/RagA family TonB-linked outer membrane protein [Aestuariibaculum sp. M13]
MKNLPLGIRNRCIFFTYLTLCIPLYTILLSVAPQIQNITINGRITDTTRMPLAGVHVISNNTKKGVVTDFDGAFEIEVNPNDSLLITAIGYKSQTMAINGSKEIQIKLQEHITELDAVKIVSTGYQSTPKERTTGSIDHINKELINRSISTNITDRLRGMTSGMLFNDNTANNQVNTSGFSSNNSGISIRGQSTINANANPLIVIDNFPFEGDLRNINPNDIESITVLKDAAAASIWGARSGNGVIVITTKKGQYNQKMKIEFNSSITIIDKPDLNYDTNNLKSSDYISVESYLFDQGYFDSDLNNTFSYPAVSPVVEILNAKRNGMLSEQEANNQLMLLENKDVRDDISKYVYQRAINQQYNVGLRGGTQDMTYQLSFGLDKNRDNLINNGFERITLNSQNTYKPTKNLELTAAVNYSNNKQNLSNEFEYENGVNYSLVNYKYNTTSIIPYLSLTDSEGVPLPINYKYRPSFIDQTRAQNFLDWNYYPLKEIENSNKSNTINSYLLRVSSKYKFLPSLSGEIIYQIEKQHIENQEIYNQNTFYTRDLINRFSQYDSNTNELSYIIPLGDIHRVSNYNWQTNNLRAQINYNQSFKRHLITGLVGAEIRERKTTSQVWGTYGYDPDYGTGTLTFNYNDFYPTNPSGSARIQQLASGNKNSALYRYISYYINGAYSYDNKYTLNLSARKDGSNIFGVKSNDRVTPLWSVGGAWTLSKESFYNITWLPLLKLRATYGYNGNVYNGSAYLTGSYTSFFYTNLNTININNAPNPELRWERIKNINIGLDFGLKENRLSGTLEYYQKSGLDLVVNTPLAPQTGFQRYNGNTASTRTNGIDLSLNSINIKGDFSWNTTFLMSVMNDKLTEYLVPQTSNSIQNYTTGIVGNPLHSIFSYQWAGLDPNTGDPQGYLNDEISKDYSGIIDNFEPKNLVFNGSAIPTTYGSLRNDFYYKGFHLSLNFLYKLGYYFRRGSINPNYAEILRGTPNIDFAKRWQNSGDEISTYVPSIVYPTNSDRATFYKYSEVLVEKGDHIRLQDIRLGYDFTSIFKNGAFSTLQAFVYAKNLGIVWRKNKHGIDPDYYSETGHTLPSPLSVSIGITANF